MWARAIFTSFAERRNIEFRSRCPVRKPSGWLGRRVVRAMNLSHVTMADWDWLQSQKRGRGLDFHDHAEYSSRYTN